MHNRDNNLVEFGNCRLDVPKRLLWADGEPVQLPPKAVELLCVLVENPGAVVTKDEIWQRVWNETFVEETNLTHNIYLLRKAFRDLGEGDLIKNVPRRGYRFTGEIRGPQDEAIVVERRSLTRELIEEIPESNDDLLGMTHVAGPASRKGRSVTLPAAVLVVASAAAIVWYVIQGRATKPAISEIRSIAVMPFTSETGDGDIEYVADGMTESLINTLSQLPKLSVRARNSVFRYKGGNAPLKAIGSDLNVQAIINGRFVRRGEHLTVYLSLVDTGSESVLWGRQYERKMSELASLQGEIARDISGSLRTQISNEDRQKLAGRSTVDPEAYLLYLRGRLYWNKRNPRDLERSIDYFQRATELDPNYAFAYAGLANAYPYLASYGNQSARIVMPKSRDAALKAISIDANLAEAHTALGLILHGFDHDFAGAEREYKLAIEQSPNYEYAHQLYGELLDCLGRHEEAETELKRALEIDPLSLIVNRMYGEHLFYTRRYDEAAEHLKKTIEIDPQFYTAHASLAYVYQAQGKYSEAAEEFAKTHEAIGEIENAAAMREIFLRNGWSGFLRYMTGEKRPKTLPMFNVAIFMAELGDNDAAFTVLNDVNEDRNYLINWINIDPRLDRVRDDPRFGELLRKMNLELATNVVVAGQ